jgi:hypothetical protein
LPERSKEALRKEALLIHKDVETKEQLRLEQRAAAKKKRAAAKAAKPNSDYPAKPTLEECLGDADVYRNGVELWQLGLDEQKARKILDSPKYSLASRDNAKRTLRKCAERRNELHSKFNKPVGERPLVSAMPAARELGDFTSREQSLTEWIAAEAKFQRENPAEYARQEQAIREAEEKRHADCSINRSHLGRLSQRGKRKSTVPTKSDGTYIRSPLQKKVWGEQSREFSRLRGEVVDAPAPPVEALRRGIAYRIYLDGLLIWADGTVCKLPLPAGTRILAAPTPPGYLANSGKVPDGLRLDVIWMIWIQK